jgi:hypothetical protein
MSIRKTESKPAISWKSLLPPIFARCVDDQRNRKYDLSMPFVVGDHIYATDGRIAVRIATPAGWPLVNAERAPLSVVAEFDTRAYRPEPTSLPKVDGDCPACGRSTYHGDRIEIAPGYWLARRFATLLTDAGAVIYLPKILSNNPTRFTIGPVDGVVMPMSDSGG